MATTTARPRHPPSAAPIHRASCTPPHTPAGATCLAMRPSRESGSPAESVRLDGRAPETFAAAQQRAHCRASSCARRRALWLVSGVPRTGCGDCADRSRGVRSDGRRAAPRTTPGPAAGAPPGRQAGRPAAASHLGHGAGGGSGGAAGGSPGGGRGQRRGHAHRPPSLGRRLPSRPGWSRHRSAPDVNKYENTSRAHAQARVGAVRFVRSPGPIARVREYGLAGLPRRAGPDLDIPRHPASRARGRVVYNSRRSVRKPCNTGLGKVCRTVPP